MNTGDFMNLTMQDKLKTVNKMLEKEDKDHLKNVSKRLDIKYSAFTSLMRDDGKYHFNQTAKRYEKIMSLDEYETYLKLNRNDKGNSNEAVEFLEKHLDDLKNLLNVDGRQLILDPKIYDPKCKTVTKSFQVNLETYNQFSSVCSSQYPHLRQKDIISQCLLDFVQRYEKTLSE